MSGNSYREKGRAVFLAAMMVLSVVAMTTAFAGGAAAIAQGSASAGGLNVDDGQTATQDVSFTAVDGDDFTRASGAGTSTVSFSEVNNLNFDQVNSVSVVGASSGSGTYSSSAVTAQVSGDSVVVTFDGDQINTDRSTSENLDVTVTVQLDTTSAEAGSATYNLAAAGSDQTADFTISAGAPDTVSVADSVELANAEDTQDVTVTVEDQAGNPLDGETVTVDGFTDAEVNGQGAGTTVSDSTSSGDVTFTLSAGNLGVGDEETIDFTAGSVTSTLTLSVGTPQLAHDTSLFFKGQDVTVKNLQGGTNYEIREATETSGGSIDSSEFVTQVTAENDGTITIDTDADLRGTGDYYVSGGNLDTTDEENLLFEVTNQTFDASFSSDSVTEDTTAELEFDSNRGSYLVNMSADGLDQADLETLVTHSDTDWQLTNDPEEGVAKHDDGNVTITLDGSTAEGAGDIYFDSDVIGTGNQTFTFNVVDTAAQDTADITVENKDVERGLVNDPYVEERGEEFNVTVDLEDTSEADIVLGNYNDVGYEVGFNVEDTSGDLNQVNVTFNSYAAGSDADLSNAIEAQHSDVDVTFAYANVTEGDTIYLNPDAFSSEDYDAIVAAHDDYVVADHDLDDTSILEDDTFEKRLASGQYALNVGQDFVANSDDLPTLDSSNDKSFIRLTDASAAGDVETHTAPEGDDMSDLEDFEDATVTATDAIANEDHLLLTIEDAGLTGLVSNADSGQIAEQLAEDGIYLGIEQTDVPANQGDRVWNTSVHRGVGDAESDYNIDNDDDVDYALDFDVVNADDYEGDQLILKVPYDQLGDNDNADDYMNGWTDSNVRALGEDNSYDWTLTFSEDSDYYDETAAVEDSLDITEREVSIGDHEEVPNADGAELGGTTTVAPGTEITLIASGDTFVQTQSPEVAEDRTFADSFNFGDYEAGTEFTIEAEEPITASDSLDAELIDAELPNFNLETDAPSEAAVGDDASLTVTVSNDGGSAGEVDIGVDVGNESVFSDNVSIDAGDEWSESFTIPTDEAGDVSWGVTAGDDSDSGTVTVSETSENGEPENGEPENGEPENGEPENGEPENGDEDSTPGFGAAVAAIALLASALLAVRQQN